MAVTAPRIDYDGRALVASHGHHTPTRIVYHDTEGHDEAGIRDLAGVAFYWHGISWGPGSQIGVDAEGYTARYVDDLEIAYHVENHNTGSLGIEQIGFARFLPSVWLLRPKQLETVAHWTAYWSVTYGIPLKLDVEHGVSTHAMQSRAFHGSHTDPGTGYPLQRVLDRAQAIVATGAVPKPKPPLKIDPFWEWARWRLGEGEFKQYGPSSFTHRPVTIPKRVPDAWWPRLGKFVGQRAAAH